LLIKCIKSVLWRVAKRLSYIEDARCLKVNTVELHTSPEGMLRCDTNIVQREVNTSLARPWKYMGEWSNSSSTICGVRDQLHVPAALTSGFHLIGSWLGLTMGLGGSEKRKICCPCLESKHDSSDVQPVAWPLHWLSYSGFHHDNIDRFLCAFARSVYYLRHVNSSAVSLSAQIRTTPISIGDV